MNMATFILQLTAKVNVKLAKIPFLTLTLKSCRIEAVIYFRFMHLRL